MLFLIAAIAALLCLAAALTRKKQRPIFHRKKHPGQSRRCLPKPPWVKREIMRIKANVPDAGRSQTYSTGVLQQRKE
jgi:hypothetical protein